VTFGSDLLAAAVAGCGPDEHPLRHVAELIGQPVEEIAEDGSPQGPRTVAFWEPTLRTDLTGENGAPVRRSAGAEAARVMADLVAEGARTLTFARSRRGAELTALATHARLEDSERLPSVFVYDGYPGGAGFAERGFRQASTWLGATAAASQACECPRACPACVQSPKCGSGNEPLDKAGAVRVLRLVLSELAHDSS
jgi:ATP-dependent helicase YprA (DUF1998 family)